MQSLFTSKEFRSRTSPCAHFDSSFTVCHGDTALFWVGIRGEAYMTFVQPALSMSYLLLEATKNRRAMLMEKVSPRTSTKHWLLFRHTMRTSHRKPPRSQQTFPHMDTPRSPPPWRPTMARFGVAGSKTETNNCLWAGAESHSPHRSPPRIFLGC